jgi:hypothetical protein
MKMRKVLIRIFKENLKCPIADIIQEVAHIQFQDFPTLNIDILLQHIAITQYIMALMGDIYSF